MRLCELRLVAFGPFSDVVVDLAAGEPALHLLYGANEAGKSTALRAITQLFYGIPERSPDAHRHPANKLRIGGRLRSAAGEELDVVRRKGRKQTLANRDETTALDEAVMQRALAGVNEALFRTVFGLDHVTLREGGRALLAGEGAVGESLFDAGGARGVARLLARLREEAGALFKPGGSKPKLNEALAAHRQAKLVVQQQEVAPQSWLLQKKGEAEALVELEQLAEERRRLRVEHHRIERALRVRAPLAQRRALAERLAGLAGTPPLADDASARRVAAVAARDSALRERQRLAAEIAELEERAQNLTVDDVLASMDEALVSELQDRLGNHRIAAQDLPKRRGELASLEREAQELARELGRATPAEALAGFGVALEQRVAALARSHEGRLEALRLADEEVEKLRVRSDERRRRLAEAPALTEASSLGQSVARARREAALDREVGELETRRAELDASVVRAHASLGWLAGRLDEVVALSLPTAETVERFVAEASAGRRRQGELDAERRRVAAELALVERELDELSLAGEPPSEELLASARAARDTLFAELLAAPARKRGDATEAYQEAVRHADAMADRLRREADRVAKHARLVAARRDGERRRADVAIEIEREEKAAAERALAWRDLFAPLAIAPGEPEDMRESLARHAALVALVERRDGCAAELTVLARRRAELVADLEAALALARGAATKAGEAGERRLAPVLDAAEALLVELDDKERDRREAERALGELELELAAREGERSQKQRALDVWRAQWSEAMGELGLDADALPEVASAHLELMRRLGDKLRQMDAMARRVAGIERDAAVFGADVLAMAADQLAGAETMPVTELAPALLGRVSAAKSAREERVTLALALDERRGRLAAAEESLARAASALDELLAAAGVTEVEALEAVEARARQLREIGAQMSHIDRVLEEAGAPLDELEDLVRDLDVDVAQARADELDERLKQVEDDMHDLREKIGSIRAGLDSIRDRDGAHEAKLAEQACLAAVREHAEHYARLHLATLILEREIERYRQEHQGPVLSRASELFRRLTLGRYATLRAEMGAGDPELRCVTHDGNDCGIAALSDGTRDQLYLALRLATLERFAEKNEMVPLVLDDVLVHFDDERAAVALELLADFAATTAQVLFFTHHRRDVELAERLGSAVRVHRLAQPPRPDDRPGARAS
jgi:uncharacterized protein YhaN